MFESPSGRRLGSPSEGREALLESVARIVVLGSTGSIGKSAIDVIEQDGAARLALHGASSHSRWRDLAEQAARHRPRFVAITDPSYSSSLKQALHGTGVEVLAGEDGVVRMVQDPATDRVCSAVVGAAGLRGTWAALEAGKIVALANKESLVVAGPLVMQLARERNTHVFPVDSEHSAIFQALKTGARAEVKRVILTSSGGPFRGWKKSQLSNVTPDRALKHPTWRMGPKITIDSATLMNKALEIIEARWLFELEPDQIEVVIHPESIIHSLVEFVDGSVIAQLSPPDMRLPIQYALRYPHRGLAPGERLDLTRAFALRFEPPDRETFPALDLGFEVMRAGGTAGAVLNAANETAVARFLNGELAFLDIARACRAIVEHHHFDPRPTLEDLLRLDAWARGELERWHP